MKKLKQSLLMLSLSTGMWEVSCSELSASLPKDEDQGANLEKQVRASHPNRIDPLTLSVLSTPIEQTLENPPRHFEGVIQHDNPPLFSFEEFKERCPGYHYKRVSIGDGLYLCGINTNVQYESFLTFESRSVEKEILELLREKNLLNLLLRRQNPLRTHNLRWCAFLEKNLKSSMWC